MENNHELRIVITPFCNYRCFFCHSEGYVTESTPLLMSPEDYEFVAKTAKNAWGWNALTITGGEPLISPIYQETCQLINNLGIGITTVTNASLISSPKKILKNNKQINVSIHSMNPRTYKRITGSSYPVEQIIETIINVRNNLPKIDIHLNATVIRGYNDAIDEMEKLIWFANKIGGIAKFIDLASSKKDLVVSIDEIIETLISTGFEITDKNTWQIFMTRGCEKVIITRCGFADKYNEEKYRNLFLHPDGTLSCGDGHDITVNVLREIHTRNINDFLKKAEWIFPIIKR